MREADWRPPFFFCGATLTAASCRSGPVLPVTCEKATDDERGVLEGFKNFQTFLNTLEGFNNLCGGMAKAKAKNWP